MWTIAIGIVLGLWLWYHVLPDLGKLLGEEAFWVGLGKVIKFLFMGGCILVGLTLLFTPELNHQVSIYFFIPPAIVLWKKLRGKGEKPKLPEHEHVKS